MTTVKCRPGQRWHSSKQTCVHSTNRYTPRKKQATINTVSIPHTEHLCCSNKFLITQNHNKLLIGRHQLTGNVTRKIYIYIYLFLYSYHACVAHDSEHNGDVNLHRNIVPSLAPLHGHVENHALLGYQVGYAQPRHSHVKPRRPDRLPKSKYRARGGGFSQVESLMMCVIVGYR